MAIESQDEQRKIWKKPVQEEIEKIGLKKEDALNRGKWRYGV